jgi:uncharacterized RDD family membrane protein YckC
METTIDEISVGRPICGFWRRLVAFIVDSIVLGLLGLALGAIFGQQFALLGALGPLVGFSIAICYFGIMNSRIGNGQSLGKKILKICVVNKEGKLISVKRSFFRAAIFSVLVCNGLSLSSVPIIEQFVSLIVTMISIGTIYFYLFNRKTRQGIHDIICGSYVYKVDAVSTSITIAVSRVHYLAYSIIFLAVTFASYTFSNQNESLLSVYRELNKLDGVYAANVNNMTTKQVFDPKIGIMDGKASTRLTATVFVYKNPKKEEELKDKIAKVVLDNYSSMQNVQTMIVDIRYGYNIGIAHNYIDSWTTGPTQKWKEKLQSKYD